MKILFLGDIVGESGCNAVKKYLPEKIINKIKLILLLLMEKMQPKKEWVLLKKLPIIYLIVELM